MEITAGYVLKALILPPGINLFALIFAWGLLRRAPRIQRTIYFSSLISLWMWCTPFVASWHVRSIENYPPVEQPLEAQADAVVILSGGRIHRAPEFGYVDAIRADTLERVRYGAVIAKKYALPIAVSGGSVLDVDTDSLATLMAASLRDDFGVEATWVESRSRNTAQNAVYLRDLLPVRRILLVTHALHMRRSMQTFRNVGFDVVPAPVGFESGPITSYGLFDYLPSASALKASRAAIHEWLGLAYYALRY